MIIIIIITTTIGGCGLVDQWRSRDAHSFRHVMECVPWAWVWWFINLPRITKKKDFLTGPNPLFEIGSIVCLCYCYCCVKVVWCACGWVDLEVDDRDDHSWLNFLLYSTPPFFLSPGQVVLGQPYNFLLTHARVCLSAQDRYLSINLSIEMNSHLFSLSFDLFSSFITLFDHLMSLWMQK